MILAAFPLFVWTQVSPMHVAKKDVIQIQIQRQIQIKEGHFEFRWPQCMWHMRRPRNMLYKYKYKYKKDIWIQVTPMHVAYEEAKKDVIQIQIQLQIQTQIQIQIQWQILIQDGCLNPGDPNACGIWGGQEGCSGNWSRRHWIGIGWFLNGGKLDQNLSVSLWCQLLANLLCNRYLLIGWSGTSCLSAWRRWVLHGEGGSDGPWGRPKGDHAHW